MKKTLISPSLTEFPQEYHSLLCDAPLYDSSCSPEARVIYIKKEEGFFLKSAPKGTLRTEADMNRYFHTKGIGPRVLSYRSEERDWLLTEAVAGEDATHRDYLSDPVRLATFLGQHLRALHETDHTNCPIPNHTERYLATAEENYHKGVFDPTFLPCGMKDLSAEEAWRRIEANRGSLQNDTLLHGDYCLPNLMLKDWKLCGFIDLGNGGVGDRHVDLFWGAWTLNFNLGTDQYRQLFFDAYGTDLVDREKIDLVGVIECFG
jgi:kanamycin kinase